MSPVLRRLGVTLRRDPAADRARALAMTSAEQLARIDVALREHDHRLTTDLADDVARALRVECGRAERLAHQSEGFEAELIAVDEALASAGATPAVDRVDAIRALADPAHQCTCGACLDRRARAADSRWRAEHWDTHSPDLAASRLGDRVEPAPDGVVDARILDALDRWEGTVPPGRWVCDACGAPVGAGPCHEHQPDAYAAMFAEAGVELSDDERAELTRTMAAAGDPGPVLALGLGQRGTLAWTATRVYGVSDRSVGITMPRHPSSRCAADLDGAACARPTGHTEPCRPAEPAPSVPVAQCPASGHRSGRCRGVAGHPGAHEWRWQW